MVVASNEKVELRCVTACLLKAMVSDVVSLSVVRYMVASGSYERVCKGVK